MALRLLFFISLFVSITARHHANHTNTNHTTRPHHRTIVSLLRNRISTYDRSIGRIVRTGVVKVYHNGRWGTICDDRFDDKDATVICRSMGYRYGVHYGYNHHLKHPLYPGQRSMPIWLDHVNCTGRERHIDQCSHRAWGRHKCSHREDVTVGCHNLPPIYQNTTPRPPQKPANGTVSWLGRPIRSSGFNGHIPYDIVTGLVQVYHNGRWGTICDDRFGHGSAQVLCRKMGHFYGIHYKVSHEVNRRHRDRIPGRNRMPIWLDDFSCRGDERNIDDCGHSPWGQHNCRHSEDVVIGCSNTTLRHLYPTRPPWTPRPWTPRPWTHRPWTHRPWTDRPYTRGPNGYVTYEDIRQLRYQVMRFLRTAYRGLQEGVSNASQRFYSRLEYLTRPRPRRFP